MTLANISPDLQEALQQLAEADQRPFEELVEDALAFYIAKRHEGVEDEFSDEEAEAVREAIEEAKKPDAIWYSMEEVEAEMNAMIDNYQPKQKQAS